MGTMQSYALKEKQRATGMTGLWKRIGSITRAGFAIVCLSASLTEAVMQYSEARSIGYVLLVQILGLK